TRRYAPRSKTGCITCRIRHVKCDEARPACNRCTSTGRKCDGYPEPSETECGKSTHRSLTVNLPALTALANQPRLGTDRENRAQEFFQVQTISQLTEVFRSELWDRYVLQLALSEPSIHYAKVALGAIHLSFSTGTPSISGEDELFALQQYNKAISRIVHPPKPLSPIVVLVACYMFSCFETIRGNHEASFRHTASGLQLISTMVHNGAEDEAIEKSLVQKFASLDLLAAVYDPGWVTYSVHYTPQTDNRGPFTSIEQAHYGLTALLQSILRFKRLEGSQYGKDVLERKDTSAEREQLLADLAQWSAAFEPFLNDMISTSAGEQTQAMQLLQIQQLAGHIHLSVTVWDEQMSYDKFLPLFQKIVSLAEVLLSPSDVSSKPDKRKIKKFLYEHGVIPSLYLAGYKCRDPVVRRKAQRLLASARRKEGVWESDVMAKVVEQIIAIEEGGG
ncbi:hypothetical protein AOQ84DRAFT_269445, partial [Glonium stellatum]